MAGDPPILVASLNVFPAETSSVVSFYFYNGRVITSELSGVRGTLAYIRTRPVPVGRGITRTCTCDSAHVCEDRSSKGGQSGFRGSNSSR